MVFHYIILSVFFVVGFITLLAVLLRWSWFFEAANTAKCVRTIGYRATRWLYGAVGVAMIAAAVYFYTQLPDIIK
jgi:hypothetical protein